jgi:ribosomal protein L23
MIDQVIIKSILNTAKSTRSNKNNWYSFIVSFHANKHQIIGAIEQIFTHIKIVKVNTLIQKPQQKKGEKYSPKFKKAYVRLAPGHTIKFKE